MKTGNDGDDDDDDDDDDGENDDDDKGEVLTICPRSWCGCNFSLASCVSARKPCNRRPDLPKR